MLALAEYVLLPVAALKGGKKELIVERRDGAEPLVYTDVQQMNEDYKNDIVRCRGIFACTELQANPMCFS